MIDIETLGIEPGAALLSIGACTFDREGVGETFYCSVDLESCQDRRLSIDTETLQWWLQQDESAREVLTGGVPLPTALSELRDFLETQGYDELWANSPKFDMAHLEAAYDALDWTTPWAFYELRDARTLQALPGAVELTQDGTEHDALDDAIHQAREVGATLRALEGAEVSADD
jgi:hypothetical protein